MNLKEKFILERHAINKTKWFPIVGSSAIFYKVFASEWYQDEF